MQCKKKLGLSLIFEMRVRASYELWEVGERSSCAYIQVAKWYALGFIHSFSFHSRVRHVCRKNPCTVQEVLAEWFSPAGEGCRARVRPPLYRATTFMFDLIGRPRDAGARAARWE